MAGFMSSRDMARMLSWKIIHYRRADNTIACNPEMTGASMWKFTDIPNHTTCKRCQRVLAVQRARVSRLDRAGLVKGFVSGRLASTLEDAQNCTSFGEEIRSLIEKLAERMSNAELKSYLIDQAEKGR